MRIFGLYICRESTWKAQSDLIDRAQDTAQEERRRRYASEKRADNLTRLIAMFASYDFAEAAHPPPHYVIRDLMRRLHSEALSRITVQRVTVGPSFLDRGPEFIIEICLNEYTYAAITVTKDEYFRVHKACEEAGIKLVGP